MTSSPWTEALIHCFFGVQTNARVSPQSSKKPSNSHLSQQPTPTAWSSSVSFRKLDVDFASRPRMELHSSHVNHQTSEMTNLILSRGDVALNKSGLGPLFFFLRDPARSYVRTIGCSLRVRPAFLEPVFFQHWLMGTFSYTACFFTYASPLHASSEQRLAPSLASSQYFPSRIEFSSCLAICGPFVRKLTPSPRLSLALPNVWKTSCLHSKRIMHGRERAAMHRH